MNPTNGQTYRVQYFERARFEYHPENAGTPYEVLLGLLGREQYLTPILRDDFSNPASGWFQERTASGNSIAYAGGGYQFSIAQANWQIGGSHANLANVADVHVEVDTTKVGGPDDNEIGVTCRELDSNNYYLLRIRSNGRYAILKKKAGVWTTLANAGGNVSTAIRQGNATNHLRVDCVGSTFTLSANGQQLLTVQDADFGTGRVALIAGTFATPGLTVVFDNFVAMRP
ncbi:MAG TPA: hypothetical protein VFL91_26545 [Thermomicrobiales bacterium]|nr:hypothetical protein [Thermomicrobiales bacterium]